jgi:uncharacterized protein YoxC
VLASTGGDVALILLAVGWLILVIFLAVVLLTTFRVMESTKAMIDGVKDETVPLLHEVTTTVKGVNRELEHVDTLLVSAGKIAGSATRLTTVVEKTVGNPLIKFAAFTAGASAAIKRLRGPKQ